MNKEFLSNIIFLIFINLLIKPFYIFGIDRTIQNSVGTDNYGLYFTLFNLTFLLQIVNDFGIQNFNNKTISQHRQLIYKFLPNILCLKLILAGIYFLILFIVSLLTYQEEFYKISHLLFLLGFNWILISFIFYLRSNISGLGFYKLDSMLSALDKLLMVGIGGFLLWGWPGKAAFKIEYFVYAQTTAFLLTAIVSGLVLYSKIEKFPFRVNSKYMFLLLKKSYPYALVIFLMTVYTRIDSVMLERLLIDGKHQAGVYASAYRLLDAVNMIGFLFAGLLLPMFARMIKIKTPVGSLVVLSLKLILVACIPVAINTIFYSNEIMDWLYVEATEEWGFVLSWLMIAFIAICSNYIFGTLLTANGSLTKMNKVFIVGVLLNVILNYCLIFNYQASGAAFTTALTQTFVLIMQIRIVYQEFQMPVNLKLILQIFLFIIASSALGYLTYHYVNLDWRLNYVISSSFCVVAAIVLGMFRPQELLSFFKDRN